MLIINNITTKFLTEYYLGLKCYIITLDIDGHSESPHDAAVQAANSLFVLIKGINDYSDPMKQNGAVSEFCKELQKLSPFTKIIILTNGIKRPVNMNSIKHVKYIIHGKLKVTGIPYDRRVNETAWKWLANAGARFIFEIQDENDFEEVNLLCINCNIKTHQVYLDYNGKRKMTYNEFVLNIIKHGYNINIKMQGDFLDDER